MDLTEKIELDITNAFVVEDGVLYLDRIYKDSIYWRIVWHETDLNTGKFIFTINNTVHTISRIWDKLHGKLSYSIMRRTDNIIPAKIIRGAWKLPHTLKTIEVMAFAGSQIEKVIFQNDCKLEHASFQDCAFLKEVSILNGKLDCGHTVFEGCRCLNHIDFKKIQLTKNSEKLFKDCGFTKVVLPAHWNVIPREIFALCMNLKEIDTTQYKGYKYTNIVEGCINLTYFNIEDSIWD